MSITKKYVVFTEFGIKDQTNDYNEALNLKNEAINAGNMAVTIYKVKNMLNVIEMGDKIS